MDNSANETIRRVLVAPMTRLLHRQYYHDPERGLHGRFSAPNRMAALQTLLAEAKDLTVLDLGCAEGLIAEGFVEAGARMVDGFDVEPHRIAAARRLVPSARARFEVGDLNDWTLFTHTHALLESYDIVLFLGIYQHLDEGKRIAALSGAAAKCRHRIAVRAPAELMDEATDVLIDEGFKLDLEISGNGLGVGRLRIHERVA